MPSHTPAFDRSLVWFRRDLRNDDHAALAAALGSSRAVFCAFVFDTAILSRLPKRDRRVEFILASLRELDAALRADGGGLIVLHGDPAREIPALAGALGAGAVFANEDYEPSAVERNRRVADALAADGRRFLASKDQVVFARDEILTQSGTPFSVFTPYKNAWLRRLGSASHAAGSAFIAPHDCSPHGRLAAPPEPAPLPSLADLGFEKTGLADLKLQPGMAGASALLDEFAGRIGRYDSTRDFPSLKGPSYLSVHLRFGTLSVRAAARLAADAMRRGPGTGAAAWLSELVWRDFYFMILHHHPHVVTSSFKPEYDRIRWEEGAAADAAFAAWCEGRTGYPLVDAAMLQLNRTGYMHNRLRMVTASFLVKDLGIDWRRGERYFAEKLNDYDLAANNGGWQWAASSGCDAQPYFRIFNPVTQSEKFDAAGKFIRRYLPQLAGLSDKEIHAPWKAAPLSLQAAGVKLGSDYPLPVVEHEAARQRTLERYAVVKRQ